MGAKVVVGARRVDRIQKVASEIKANGGKALALATDVTNKGDVKIWLILLSAHLDALMFLSIMLGLCLFLCWKVPTLMDGIR